MKKLCSIAVVTAVVSVFGCATEMPESAAVSSDVPLAREGTITSVNADGSWTATANAPGVTYHYDAPDCVAWSSAGLTASASFTGPSGKTRKMGVCLLQLTTTVCSTVADCASSPSTLPTGGSRYCTNIDNTGTKYCAFRAGTQSGYCAGSPALGGTAVAPGTYATNEIEDAPPTIKHVSYACFEGCSATDPSVSSAASYKAYNAYCVRYPDMPSCYCF